MLNQKFVLIYKAAIFLYLAFKTEKVKTKHKNSTLCYSEKLAFIYTQLTIHKHDKRTLKVLALPSVIFLFFIGST